jgi:transcriptional regulator with XRE-family HTH domain
MGFREDRLRLGLTVSELAKNYGVSPSTIRRWERGGRISTKTLVKVTLSYSVREQFALFSYLFSGPWKGMAEHPSYKQGCNELLEDLRERMENEDNASKLAA